MLRRAMLLGFVLASLSGAPRALADSSPEDRAAADALYEEAGKLMKAGRFADACPKVEASLRLDPGIGSTMRLAYCYEKTGRTASAWSLFNEAATMARKANDKRADEAAQHAKELEPHLSRMTLAVAPATAQAEGIEIRRDGKVLDKGAWSSAVPVDPGPHVLEASAPRKATWKTTVTIAPKPGTTTLQVPALLAAPERHDETNPSSWWNGQRIGGVTGIAAGGVGIVLGSVFGALAIKKASDAKKDNHCDEAFVSCDAVGMQLRADGKTMTHASTAALVIGGAAVAAGVTLLVTAPKAATPKAAAWVGVGPGGGFVRGVW